jgi:hypothetical protein
MVSCVFNLNHITGEDTISMFRRAVKYCRQNPGTTFNIPPGRYVIQDDEAICLMNKVMVGEMGNNPQTHIFAHYYPYVRGIDFSGCKDITVNGYGVRIICDGWMEPISIENSQNITINGLTIDYLRKPYSIGTVICSCDTYYDVTFPDVYPVNINMPTPRIYIYSREKNRFEGNGWACDKKELIASQTIRFHGEKPLNLVGSTVCMWHSLHFRPAIFINESINTTLFDVTIHSQPGMGIVGHRSENICLNRLRIVPEAGEFMSVNTDATHFTSCKGDLRLEACQFDGHGDDAINVHNYYYTIMNAQGNTCDITVDDADAHAQVLDYPDISDVLELVDAETLSPVREYQVKSIVNDQEHWKSKIVLDADLPVDYAKYYLINITRLPKLSFLNCHIRNHLSRGVLIKTRHALVAGCSFENCTGTAIHVAAEGGWHEGVTAAHVTIRNNRMISCGHGMKGYPLDVCGVCINIDAAISDTPNLHKDITIENNIISGEQAAFGIYVANTEGVNIRYNEISGCKNPICILYSSLINIQDNHLRPCP